MALLISLCVISTFIYIISATERVTGGNDITISSVPWQVSLHNDLGFICGGIIISQNWIITAAHCCSYYPVRNVRSGSSFYSSGGTVHQVDKVIIHHAFSIEKYGLYNNDIALLHIIVPFSFDDTRQAILLYDIDEPINIRFRVQATGWGDMIVDARNLHAFEAALLPKVTCNSLYSKYGGIYDNQICLDDLNGYKATCTKDAGGPVVINRRLGGVISWSHACGHPNSPTIFTEISRYRLWIKRNTGI